jgi:hypothetical protein
MDSKPFRLAIFCALLILLALAGSTFAAIYEARPLSLNDAPDWPVALDVAPDGRVWVAMATDVSSLGGVARYTADLDFEEAWQIEGRVSDVATAPDGSVYLPAAQRFPEILQRIFRLSSEGVILGFSRDGFNRTYALAAHAEGVWELGQATSGVTTTLRAIELDPIHGGLKTGFSFEAPTGQDVTVRPEGGELYLLDSTGFAPGVGRIVQLSPDGRPRNEWVVHSPLRLDYHEGSGNEPEPSLYVAHDDEPPIQNLGSITIQTTDGTILSSFETKLDLIDVSAAPNGDVYLLGMIRAAHEVRYCLQRYNLVGRLLNLNCELEPVMGRPAPPVATPTLTATATATPSPETPTPIGSVTVPLPETPTPTGSVTATVQLPLPTTPTSDALEMPIYLP